MNPADNLINTKWEFKSSSDVKSPDILNYQMLFWLFMAGSVMGFVLEGLWSIAKNGYWERHSAVLWGPFCAIYGIGAVVALIISQRVSRGNLLMQFGVGFVFGTLVEYFVSLFQEFFFGSISWDYSGHFLNIGGRVSLKMAFIWGVIGVLFIRFIFPILYPALKKLNGKRCALLCGALTVFMVLNFAATYVALTRWQERQKNIQPNTSIERFTDLMYGDGEMEQLFPGRQFVYDNIANN